MVYKILSPLSHISVISVKVKFYRLNITLLRSVCLMCLEIWNLKINQLILVPQNIYPFKELGHVHSMENHVLECGYLEKI